jgi:hypothetical protein
MAKARQQVAQQLAATTAEAQAVSEDNGVLLQQLGHVQQRLAVTSAKCAEAERSAADARMQLAIARAHVDDLQDASGVLQQGPEWQQGQGWEMVAAMVQQLQPEQMDGPLRCSSPTAAAAVPRAAAGRRAGPMADSLELMGLQGQPGVYSRESSLCGFVHVIQPHLLEACRISSISSAGTLPLPCSGGRRSSSSSSSSSGRDGTSGGGAHAKHSGSGSGGGSSGSGSGGGSRSARARRRWAAYDVLDMLSSPAAPVAACSPQPAAAARISGSGSGSGSSSSGGRARRRWGPAVLPAAAAAPDTSACEAATVWTPKVHFNPVFHMGRSARRATHLDACRVSGL